MTKLTPYEFIKSEHARLSSVVLKKEAIRDATYGGTFHPSRAKNIELHGMLMAYENVIRATEELLNS